MRKFAINNINKICALVFVVALCLPLAIRFPYLYDLYANQFSQIKTEIEERFSAPPKEGFFKRLFLDYMSITNRHYVNGVIIMNDGRRIYDVAPNPQLLSEIAEHIIEFCGYLESRNTPLLFVMVPNAMRDNSQMPRGFANSVVEDTAWFMAKLKENGVDTLDLRETMTNENIDFSTAFFHGDHHWTAETALWAYGKTAAQMNNKYGFHLDEKTWNPQEYKRITYSRAFRGTLAIAMGDIDFRENITALIPQSPTEFIISEIDVDESGDVEKNILVSGDFADVFAPLTKNANNNTFTYHNLNEMRRGTKEYHNLLGKEHKRVLLIADSYGLPYATYLAATLEYMDYFFLADEEKRKLYPLLNSEEYDVVLFLVYDWVLLNPYGDGSLEQHRMYLGKP
jgi:hypothetical protein